MEHDHQDQVQHHIDKTGDGQIHQRTAGIAHGADDACAEIVQHVEGHADEVNAQVQGGQVDDVVGAAHHVQQGTGQAQAQDHDKHTGHQRQGDGGMHAAGYALTIACAVGMGDDDVAAQGKTHEQVGQQVNQRAGGAHRRQGLGACKLADNGNIRSVIKQLQDAGEHQRQGEAEHQRKERPLSHIEVAVTGKPWHNTHSCLNDKK